MFDITDSRLRYGIDPERMYQLRRMGVWTESTSDTYVLPTDCVNDEPIPSEGEEGEGSMETKYELYSVALVHIVNKTVIHRWVVAREQDNVEALAAAQAGLSLPDFAVNYEAVVVESHRLYRVGQDESS